MVFAAYYVLSATAGSDMPVLPAPGGNSEGGAMKRIKKILAKVMEWVKNFSQLDPITFRSAVVAIVSALGALGFEIAPGIPDTVSNIFIALTTVSAMVAGLWARRAATANTKVVVVAPDPVAFPEYVVPGAAKTTAGDADILEAARSVPVVGPME